MTKSTVLLIYNLYHTIIYGWEQQPFSHFLFRILSVDYIVFYVKKKKK